MVKYPNCNVQLVGQDGNAFSILSRVNQALRNHLREEGKIPEEIKQICAEYQKEATSGNYDNLLCVTMDWVNCDGEDDMDYEGDGYEFEDEEDE